MSAADRLFQVGNPFPPIPAARLGGFADETGASARSDDEPVTIDTDALDHLREQADDYFRRTAGGRLRGRAVALVGTLGIGKTHLANSVTTQLREREEDPPVWVIDEPVVDLGMVYRDRLMRLSDDRTRRVAFEDVVIDYYADVAALRIEEQDDGGPQSSHAQIAQGLRLRTIDPHKAVDALQIDEELIHRDLQRHLGDITEHRKFATALTLLLDRDFKRLVWDWLGGAEPAQPLVDRGIRDRIDGIDAVFDVLAVFAFLHGRVGKPYALVLDALEKVLDWPEHDQFSFVDAFERLVNVYTNEGGLLVFCVSPAPLSRFRPNLHERIMQIWPSPLDQQQTARLVQSYLPQADRPLFTAGSLAEICQLAGGVPRQVLKTCWWCWNLMESSPRGATVVDERIVHAAVRRLYRTANQDYVLGVIEAILVAGQWRTEEPSPGGPGSSGAAAQVDFWVRVSDTSRIAVLTVGSVLVDAEVDVIAGVVRAARAASEPGHCAVLVVVNGHLSRRMRERVARVSGAQPIVYETGQFEELVREALHILAERLKSVHRDSAEERLSRRIGGLSSHQDALLDHIQRIDSRLERVLATAQRPARPFMAATRSVPEPMAGEAELPVRVAEEFTRAFDALDVLYDPRLPELLDVDASGTVTADEAPRRLRFTPEQFQTMGVATLLRHLLTAFRDGVAGWLSAVRVANPSPSPGADQIRNLFVLCRSFEITTEVLPLARAERHLPLFAPADGSHDTLDTAGHALLRADAEDVLRRLAERVNQRVLEVVRGGAAPEFR
ncbi:hypothetical protein [Streptomyces odontomachi]|uniref:hypothetical protein n=1 Tax=Streptomyces odontomachi TaxID=2944940 RepID=UPI00210BE7E8|nr:hypothetical protein [Streptomyces sp. ODS25]